MRIKIKSSVIRKEAVKARKSVGIRLKSKKRPSHILRRPLLFNTLFFLLFRLFFFGFRFLFFLFYLFFFFE